MFEELCFYSLFLFVFGHAGTMFLWTCFMLIYAWRLCCVYVGVVPEDSSSESVGGIS